MSNTALPSTGPWSQEATPSSDFRYIRYITDANARVIADVRYAEGAEQAENLANAQVLQNAWRMLEKLRTIEAQLASHPDASNGNSQVHLALCAARNGIAAASGKRDRAND